MFEGGADSISNSPRRACNHGKPLPRRYGLCLRLLLISLTVCAVLAVGLVGRSTTSAGRGEEGDAGESSTTAVDEIMLSEIFGSTCMMPDEGAEAGAQTNGADSGRAPLGGDVPPTRMLEDPYPSFNGVAVDPESNLAFLSDTNRKSLLVYDRTAGGKTPAETPPRQHIIGPSTLIGYIAGVTFDTARREIYAVNNDIEDSLMVFPYEGTGNAKPKRALLIPHGAWGIALNKARGEFSLSIQDGSTNAVVTYVREAQGFDPPKRVLAGTETGLADPHGIYVDDARGEMFVSNWGSWNVRLGRYTTSVSEKVDPPGGSFREPSISVYASDAQGNTKPLRTIQGPATGMNWPTGIDLDSVSGELFVANNAADSIIVFGRNDSGNVRPSRVIRGRRTGLVRPMAVAVDRKNKELWVANFGDHTALVFDLNASGNAAPKRVIRNAPAGTPTAGFGNPITVAYDSRRGELLVPN
jgi:DNA-binding beta-propeller fold protein YncE